MSIRTITRRGALGAAAILVSPSIKTCMFDGQIYGMPLPDVRRRERLRRKH
jgi:hypothetical protein